MKLWQVAGVLSLIGVQALLSGYSYPFFSLALDKHALATWLIGLNASFAAAGVLAIGPFLPPLIARLGVRLCAAAMFALSLAAFGAILAVDTVLVWFPARFVIGACMAGLWTTTDIWLNGVIDDDRRQRIIGASSVLAAAGQVIGPLVLGGGGAAGTLPLLIAMVPLAAAGVIALAIRPAGKAKDGKPAGDPRTLKRAASAAGGLMVAAVLAGTGQAAMLNLLPLYGLAHGFTDAEAARLVAVFILGGAVLVAGLGALADRIGRSVTLLLCALAAALASFALPVAMADSFLTAPIVFVAGGTISGVYALSIMLVGQDLRGRKLAAVSSGLATAHALGAILGAALLGYLMDAFDAEALPMVVAAAFASLSVYLLQRGRGPARSRDAIADPVTAGQPEGEAGPAVNYDMSFLHEIEPIHVEKTEIGDLHVGNDREWQESNLEEWFRQRAAELARRSTQRHQPGANRLEGLQTHQPGER